MHIDVQLSCEQLCRKLDLIEAAVSTVVETADNAHDNGCSVVSGSINCPNGPIARLTPDGLQFLCRATFEPTVLTDPDSPTFARQENKHIETVLKTALPRANT